MLAEGLAVPVTLIAVGLEMTDDDSEMLVGSLFDVDEEMNMVRHDDVSGDVDFAVQLLESGDFVSDCPSDGKETYLGREVRVVEGAAEAREIHDTGSFAEGYHVDAPGVIVMVMGTAGVFVLTRDIERKHGQYEVKVDNIRG